MHETFDQFLSLDLAARREWIESAEVSRFSGITDDAGRVTLRGLFPAGGHRSFLVNRGSYGIRGQIGIIRDTEILLQRPLAEIFPSMKRSLDDKLPEIELAIESTQP